MRNALSRADLDVLARLKDQVLRIAEVPGWRTFARRQLIEVKLGPEPGEDALCCFITERGLTALQARPR